jgi:hypothetical protein
MSKYHLLPRKPAPQDARDACPWPEELDISKFNILRNAGAESARESRKTLRLREREKMRKQAAEDEAEQRIRAEKRERAKDVEPAREAPLGRRTFKFIRGFKTKSWRRRSTRH